MTPQKTVQVALWCLEKGGVRFVTGRILATACENWFGFLPGNFLLGRVAKACLSMLRQHRFWANTISLVRANLLTGNKRDCPKWFCFNIPGEGRFPSVGFVTDAEVGKMLLLIELGRILASNWANWSMALPFPMPILRQFPIVASACSANFKLCAFCTVPDRRK